MLESIKEVQSNHKGKLHAVGLKMNALESKKATPIFQQTLTIKFQLLVLQQQSSCVPSLSCLT